MTGSVNILGHNQRISGFNHILRTYCPNTTIVDIIENFDDEQIAY